MITNFYTLFHLADELNRDFAGGTIDEIFSQYRDELVISFKGTSAAIIIGCGPSGNYLYARKTFSRAQKNSVDLFITAGKTIVDKIYIHPFDRQLHFQLKNACELILQFFGPKANVLLIDNHGEIVEIFLNKLNKDDAKAGLIPRMNNKEILDLSSSAIIESYKDQSLTTALKQIFPRLGAVLIRELIVRTGLGDNKLISESTEDEIKQILKNVKLLTEELSSAPFPRIYFDGSIPVCFSIIPLHLYQELKYQSFDTVSEGVQSYRAAVHHEKEFMKDKDDIIRALKRELDNAEQTLNKISKEIETPDQIKQYEKYGKLLMAQLHLIKKGDITAYVEDFIDDAGNIIEISLDMNLSPSKNAERFFKKAEKSHRTSQELNQRILELARQNKCATRLIENAEEISSPEDLKCYIEENKQELAQFGLKSKKPGLIKKETPPPFRVFIVAGGFQVWAGKSGENNDLLSTRHTAKNDLWFHARGVGGSHVVLKIGTGKGEVSKQAIDQAAGIAAYYSKMKKSKLVPITMCEGKYVRKPKGAPAGTVTVEREKTIFAEPALPESR